MHNKCMELHTKIEFSKPAHRRCDAHVVSQPVSMLQGSGAVVCSRSVKRDAKTRAGAGERQGPHFWESTGWTTST